MMTMIADPSGRYIGTSGSYSAESPGGRSRTCAAPPSVGMTVTAERPLTCDWSMIDRPSGENSNQYNEVNGSLVT